MFGTLFARCYRADGEIGGELISRLQYRLMRMPASILAQAYPHSGCAVFRTFELMSTIGPRLNFGHHRWCLWMTAQFDSSGSLLLLLL